MCNQSLLNNNKDKGNLRFVIQKLPSVYYNHVHI